MWRHDLDFFDPISDVLKETVKILWPLTSLYYKDGADLASRFLLVEEKGKKGVNFNTFVFAFCQARNQLTPIIYPRFFQKVNPIYGKCVILRPDPKMEIFVWSFQK